MMGGLLQYLMIIQRLVRITYREYSNIETKVKEAIDWTQQQIMHDQ